MLKLCLMASHGYPTGLVFHQEQGLSTVIKECQPLPIQGARQNILQSGSCNLKPSLREEAWKPFTALCEPNQPVKFDSTVQKPFLINKKQDAYPDSVLFSLGIAEKCTRHEKILQFLTSGSNDLEKGGLDLSTLSELMGLQPLMFDAHPKSRASSLIYPSSNIDARKPLLDFFGDMVSSSKITVNPDGRVLLTATGAELKDILSIVAGFYLSENSNKSAKQSMLVPYFDRRRKAQANVSSSSSRFEALTVAPAKSPEKIKLKPSPKKKNSSKVARERDLYKKNYFHACESLMSLMIDKRQHGKTAILSIKKSGPELPELLTQFSAGIAGTGLAVLFSVICKVAYGRVPLGASKFVSTGFGFGLVWLSWSVNRLRDTVLYISKNASKLGLKEEDMIKRVDRSVKEIYFRAAALMAVAVLRLA